METLCGARHRVEILEDGIWKSRLGEIFRSFAARFSWESLRAVADDPRPPSLPGSTSEKPQRVAHLDSPSDLGSQILDETGGWCCVGGCLSDRGS